MKPREKYHKDPDRILLVTTLVLIVFGLVAVSSASTVLSFQRFGNNTHYLFRQLIAAGAGLVGMWVVSRIDYQMWRKWSRVILFVSGLSLALVLIPGLGFKTGGTRGWFSIGPFLLQPSEFAKLAIIFYLASWFERKPGAENNFWFGILPALFVIGIPIGLIILEPDIGTVSIIAMIVATIFFAAGVRLKYLAGLASVSAAALWILVKSAPYRAARILTFLNPSLDVRGIGYHINQALLAIGSGGLWGYGFGASRQKHNYLPESIGDSIFAVMAEELGFVRIILLILLFAVFGLAGFRLAKKAPDRFSQLAVVGITGWVVFQALLNIGAITGLLPLTGVTLPFISYGGSSIVALSLGVGVLLNISKQRV